jgi:transposase-like protein
MARRPKPEEIVAKLRQVDVLVSQGGSVADAVRSIGVTEVTYHRWRKEFGGLKVDQVKRLKDLETENQRLRKAVADLTLDKLILAEAARETTKPRPPARLCRSRQDGDEAVRAACLPRPRAAPFDTASGAAGP